MKIATCKILLGAIVALVSAHANAAWDGPFGLKEGLSLAEIKSVAKVVHSGNALTYTADTLPVPHAAFALYVLKISDKAGLCEIIAVSPQKPTDAFGEGLLSNYGAVRDALVEKYGPPSGEEDSVRPGSMWTAPQHFMMGLMKGERSLRAIWLTGKSSKLPATLSRVGIIAGAESPSKGNFSLQYRFSNHAGCTAEEKALENKGL
jgi:hypothetical protein